jgi:hypothetical protein
MAKHGEPEPSSRDPVAEYFETRGVSENVRTRGLRGLVADWVAIARSAGRYNLTLDDWVNDLDLRDIIAGALAVAPDSERHAMRDLLERADEEFRAATFTSAHAAPHNSTARANAYDPTRQWWYFRYPAHPGDSMRADLNAAGVKARS